MSARTLSEATILTLVARLQALPDTDRRTMIDWLANSEADAMQNDPSVGIYPMPDVAEGFRILDQLVGSGELGRKVPHHGSGPL